NCYFDKELVQVKDYYSWGGGIHYIGDPKTTNEMHAKATYVDWDFDNIWGRNETINDGYPYLRIFHEGAPSDSPDPIIVTGISLNVTDTMLITGQTLQMVATVTPENAENKKVIWTATTWGTGSDYFSDEWFEMDENGFITTHVDLSGGYTGRSGKIRVIATTEEGEYTAECLLTIRQPQLYIKNVAGRRVGETEWDTQCTGIGIENFEYLVMAYTNPDDEHIEVTWSVDDTNVLEVTELSDTIYDIPEAYTSTRHYCARAIVRAKQAAANNVYLYATHANGLTANLWTRPQLFELSDIWICKSPASYYMSPDTYMDAGSQQQLDYLLYKGEGYDKTSTKYISYLPTLEWSSSDQSVLTVDQNGLVTAVGPGSATITLTAVGTSISYTTDAITVSAVEPTGIQINEGDGWTTLEVAEGSTLQLTATVMPANASDKTVTWSSNNTNIATVDQNGLVTGVATSYWEVRITATTVNGMSASINVRVTEPLSSTHYTIRFLNYDGTELQSSQVLEGDIPAYTGATPTKQEDDTYTYEFSGWSPAIVAAVANADYTAQYTATEKSATGIEEIDASKIVNGKSSNRKLLIDGTLYILRGDKTYTVQGAEVK
ncbi:MAG: Ig-like domain-containing protein, partial [Paludibacteraceae bacterium]|nr:Ig-like domain-containing protein [Paludibacteraceae bacterium]